MPKIKRPVLRYFGGKWRIAPWIIDNLPDHSVYCEPFGGGASVLMQKRRSKTEIYNDMDSEVVNVFRVLRDRRKAKQLHRALELTPFSRDEFKIAHTKASTMVEQARRTIVRSFMGHGADSTTRKHKSGFRAKSFDSNRDASKDWSNYHPAIEMFTTRLQGVIIENRDAMKVMETNDSDKTVFYVDPPYPMGVRSSGESHGYRHEMSDADHEYLCKFLSKLKAKVVLSGYPGTVYDQLGWHSIQRKSLADGAKDRMEVLWFNPAAMEARGQHDLFDAGE